jgi:hypothetical protein
MKRRKEKIRTQLAAKNVIDELNNMASAED